MSSNTVELESSHNYWSFDWYHQATADHDKQVPGKCADHRVASN